MQLPTASCPGPGGCGLVLALLALGSCSGGSTAPPERTAPVWISLARGARPGPLEGLIAAWAATEPLLAVRAAPDGAGVWIDNPIEAAAWERSETDSGWEEWSAARPAGSGFEDMEDERLELRLGGRSIPRQLRRFVRGHHKGEYCLVNDKHIVLVRPAALEPPAAGVLSSWLERGHEEAGTWRATIASLVADGLTVWPGERLELVRDIPATSALRFVTASRGLGRAGTLRFRVKLDGDVLFEHEQASEQASGVPHVVALPPSGRTAARLAFEVEGPPAVSGFLEPVIGPAEIGTYGARPWTPRHSDIVLFVADTFRADNLAAYGGDARVCPSLNHLAERSVRFLGARSASVWTLPSHGALFTGLYPPQHGADGPGLILSESIVTLAEHLASAGYRTGAVTDSGYVSRQFGLDQGFSWFEEQNHERRRLRTTLARADGFLARDDGRPLFLFVHTYRTHSPYRQGADESETELRTLLRQVRETTDARFGKHLDPQARPFLPAYLELYRGGATGLDLLFGPWFERLEALGLFRAGYFVFTSDHGEAFFEHGSREHEGPPHEEKVRIPLFVFGAGLAPRDVRYGVNHVDFAPTISALAGLPPVPGWTGAPLLALDRERLLFIYNRDKNGVYLATIEGDKKLIETGEPGARPQGSFGEAYSLGTDPGERRNLAGEDLPWPRELADRSRTQLEGILRCLVQPAAANLTDDARANLEALGYGE